MQMTPLQLQIQERADKTLSFGCIIIPSGPPIEWIVYDYVVNDLYKTETAVMGLGGCVVTWSKEYIDDKCKIIGHPMNWGRLWYLLRIKQKPREGLSQTSYTVFSKIERFAMINSEVYQQTVLERPVELQELVLAFLNTLGPLQNK